MNTIKTLFLLFNQITFAQKIKYFAKIADSSYSAKNYQFATDNYLQEIKITDFNSKKASLFYNMACCQSLQNKTDEAIAYLKESIKLGYSNK